MSDTEKSKRKQIKELKAELRNVTLNVREITISMTGLHGDCVRLSAIADTLDDERKKRIKETKNLRRRKGETLASLEKTRKTLLRLYKIKKRFIRAKKELRTKVNTMVKGQ